MAPASIGLSQDKDRKRVEPVGRKMARVAATQWHIANSNALLKRYTCQHREDMEGLRSHLREEYQKSAKAVFEEGKNIANLC